MGEIARAINKPPATVFSYLRYHGVLPNDRGNDFNVLMARLDRGTFRGSPFLVSSKYIVDCLKFTLLHFIDNSSPRRIALSRASITAGLTQGLRQLSKFEVFNVIMPLGC